MSAPRRRPEKHLERLVLREVGRHPQMLIGVNAVGLGYRGTLLHALVAALQPFGPAAIRAAVDATQRHRITYGMGVGSCDMFGSYRGLAFGWELKTEVGRLSEDQIRWHRAAAARGLRIETIRSVGEAAEAMAKMDTEASGRRGGVE